jgi:integrase/recombinase XerD
MAIKFIRHSATPGLAIWQIDWWPDGRKGKRRYKSVECTQEEAGLYEAEVKKCAGIGREVFKITRLTLIEALPEYLRWHGLNLMPRTHADVKLSMPGLMAVFGNLTPSQIRPSHITDFVSLRPDKKRANQKDIHYLQGLITWMVKNSLADPLTFKPETPKYHRPLPSVPTATDVEAVLSHITEPITRALIYLMWTTGARISTANQVRWENINWDSGTIIVTVKGGRPMLLPVPDEFRAIMEPVKQEYGWVFLNKKTSAPILSIKKALATASAKAGLHYVMTHHKFRHAYATDTLTATGDLRLVQSALGHKDIHTTTIYTQVQTSRIADAQALVQALRKSTQKP